MDAVRLPRLPTGSAVRLSRRSATARVAGPRKPPSYYAREHRLSRPTSSTTGHRYRPSAGKATTPRTNWRGSLTSADERDFNCAALDHAWSQLITEVTEGGSLLAVTQAFVIAWFVRLAMEAPTHRRMGLNPATPV